MVRPSAAVNFPDLVRAVALRDPQAEIALYRIFNDGMRFLIGRQVGPEPVEDILHTSYIVVINAIRDRRINDPERLVGYIRTVVQRQIAEEIHSRSESRKNCELTDFIADKASASSEAAEGERQRMKIARDVLMSLRAQHREILVRFYLKEQSQEQICAEMALTSGQFRNLKHRGKAAFTEKVQAAMQRKPVRSASPGKKQATLLAWTMSIAS